MQPQATWQHDSCADEEMALLSLLSLLSLLLQLVMIMMVFVLPPLVQGLQQPRQGEGRIVAGTTGVLREPGVALFLKAEEAAAGRAEVDERMKMEAEMEAELRMAEEG